MATVSERMVKVDPLLVREGVDFLASQRDRVRKREGSQDSIRTVTAPGFRRGDFHETERPTNLASLRAGPDQSTFVGEDDDLDAVAQIEFGEDAGDVGLDGARGYVERGGDLGVRKPTG